MSSDSDGRPRRNLLRREFGRREPAALVTDWGSAIGQPFRSSFDSGALFVWRETDVVPTPRRDPAEEGEAWAFAPT